MRRRHAHLLLYFLLFATTVAGQELDESNFTRYTTADGMSHNNLTGLLQDSTGYIWVASSYGLNRFNGSKFVQYHSNSDSLSISVEDIAGMTWLDKDHLAVFTNGLHIIDTRTGDVSNLVIPYHNSQYQFKFNMIVRAMGDNKGHRYVLTRSGFYHFDENFKLLSRFDFYREDKVAVSHFYFGRGLLEMDSKRMMIVALDGLYIYDKEKLLFRRMTAADSPVMSEFLDYPNDDYQFYQHKPGRFFVLKSFTDSVVYINVAENRSVVSHFPIDSIITEFSWRTKIVAASDTVFYLTGHNSGFYKMRFYPPSGAVKLYREKYFSSYLCSNLLKDKDGKLWVATNRGLFRQNSQRPASQAAILPASIEDKYPNIWMDDIYVSKDKVYAGAWDKAGLFIYDKKTLRIEKQVSLWNGEARANFIRAMVPLDNSTLLLGTNGPLLLFDLATNKSRVIVPPKWSLANDWSSDIYRDSEGRAWIASATINRYDHRTGKFELIPNHPEILRVPYAMEEDRDKHIWIAGHGIARYNTTERRFDRFLDSFPSIRMPDKQVNSMAIDKQNRLWFNSNNNGLILYDIDSRRMRHFTKSDGLPDNNISSLFILGNKLWIACYSGIACMDLQSLQIVSFGKEDGIPAMPILKGAKFFYDSSDKQIYIGLSHAIVRFDPEYILRKRTSPHVFIENLVINGRKNYFLPGNEINTSWRDNEIIITIGSINFIDGNSQGFAYRIFKDSSTAWQQLGIQPSFNISNLPPGKYRVQVKVFSINNRWQEQVKEIIINILPPFWLKTWFKILSVLVLLVLIYLLISWRTGVATKKEMEKTHLQKLKADDYKNQFELEQISNYFSSSLAGKKTVDEVLWDVAGNLIARLNYVDCMIYLWNEDKTKMVQKAAHGPKGKPEYIRAQVFDVLPGQGIVGHVLQTLQPVLVNDTRTDSRYRKDEAFRLSEICVPILHNGELLGIIDSEHHQAGYFTERDITIMTTIATLIGNKLKQLESEQILEVKRRELAGINEQLAEAKLSALQAQMNPHFVFNALNSIKRMILDGENEKASRYLSKFALMIRMTLNHSKGTFVTIGENIEFLKTYLEMEQLRFDDSFTWKIDIDEETDTEDTMIPSLMIQPLVENAIWHGLLQVEGEKKLLISFTTAQDRITCSIEDNGIGIFQAEKLKLLNRSQHRSVGLENLRNRIKILNEKYHIDCRLEITDLCSNEACKRGTLAVLGFNEITI
jgi:putative methionine-R-sulfoxide reductase with GAF domain